MRVLFLLQGNEVSDQPGYDDGFRRLLAAGVLQDYRAIPYRGHANTHGWQAFYDEAFNAAKDMNANYVFLQFFHGDMPSPKGFIEKVRALKNSPTVISSCGDAFGPILNSSPKSLVDAAAGSDLTFSTGMGRLARQLAAKGAPKIVLMPNGYCQVRFGKEKPKISPAPEFDIVFIGSLTWARNPLRHYFWTTLMRKSYVDALTRRYGKRFAIFGNGWKGNPSWQGPVPYLSQEQTCQRGRFVFGGYPGATTDYYTSDRVFIAAVSGVPIVDYWGPRVDKIFMPEKHWYLFRDKKEMISTFDRLIDCYDSLPMKVGLTTANLVREKHSQYHRVKSMMEIATKVRAAGLMGANAPLPKLDFFHDEVSLEEEYRHAVFNWNSTRL